ncbi:GNAT family N-acetyltransferase [Methylobacterium currus]|uniref:GNAT family N-acetyltransferase n=1 Tax=Methylobacterium currus TaxID=2051553 RepID=A0A2R4WVQ3_9HYPH|nr:GNAT family N-acetyltransferase [Methylobacterium currus]AWB25603.1 GNAT family N-acetyltransferase [Methylobacterium currus]
MTSRHEITIRPARPDDGDAVTAVLSASYPVLRAASYEADTLARALPLMVRANPTLLASGSFHLAKRLDSVVGVGGWTPERPGTGEIEPGLGHIRHFAVHPAWTGCGVGRSLFSACRAHAQECGVPAFECYASLNAEPFYRALGFRAFGRREIPMGGTAAFPAVLMRCRL